LIRENTCGAVFNKKMLKTGLQLRISIYGENPRKLMAIKKMFRLISISITSLFVAAQPSAQTSASNQDRPTIAKVYGKLFAIALACDELDTKKTGAAKKAFIEHVVTPTSRISDKFAPGGEIRKIVDNPPEQMLTETQAMIKSALPSKLKEMRSVCADYERSVKGLAASINSFVDVTQGDLVIPPAFFEMPGAQPNAKKAVSEKEEDEDPIPDVFPSRAAFQMRVNILWATGTACIDPEPDKYKSVVELWRSKLAPKIIEKTGAAFAKSFSRFKGPDDPLYETNRIKNVIPGLAEDCKALESNVERLIAAQVP
jgi:hypothetical protein